MIYYLKIVCYSTILNSHFSKYNNTIIPLIKSNFARYITNTANKLQFNAKINKKICFLNKKFTYLSGRNSSQQTVVL